MRILFYLGRYRAFHRRVCNPCCRRSSPSSCGLESLLDSKSRRPHRCLGEKGQYKIKYMANHTLSADSRIFRSTSDYCNRGQHICTSTHPPILIYLHLQLPTIHPNTHSSITYKPNHPTILFKGSTKTMSDSLELMDFPAG